MISKGTTHNSGTRLAAYLTNGKNGERAELWQLERFECDDIRSAFKNIHIMAEGTHCVQPFFHVQVRNRENEHLTREQWERVANRIESKLGLAEQPRAIVFHQNVETGREHMHVAWSRIDEETMTARRVPFYKLRLKEVSRELELELGLAPVRNRRESAVMAPTKNEDQQARRLGVDIHHVRDTIRECWEHSDNGTSFRAALAEEGLTLAKGDKRDLIVVDQEGGIHALGKRILGETAAQIRQRAGDIDREHLPTVVDARVAIAHAREIDGNGQAITCGTASEQGPELGSHPVEEIRRAMVQAPNAAAFSAALEHEGFRIAIVKPEDLAAISAEHAEGSIVIVSRTGEVLQLDQNTTGATVQELQALFASIDRRGLSGVEQTQEQIHLETSRFIALSGVGTPQQSTSEPPIDFERMFTDRDYRRMIEKTLETERKQRQELQEAKPRSPELER